MSIFDLLVEIPNKVKSNITGATNKIRGVQAPHLDMELLDEKGGTDINKTMAMLDKTTPLTFGERMLGRELSRNFQKYNPDTKQFEMTTATINRPGLLQDISQGYQENRFTPGSLDNLQQNTLANGRNKGFAYRLGEGLGSLARIGETPLGRSLLVGGLVGATGGSGLEALSYGAQTGMLNQANRMRDKVYRNDLLNSRKASLMQNPNWNTLSADEQNEILAKANSMDSFKTMTDEQKQALINQMSSDYLRNRQQEQLSSLENEINSYRGYLDNNTYNNMIQAQQLRDNAAYRQMYFDAQQRNLEAQREWQRQQAEKENQLRAQQLYLTGRGQDLNYALGAAKLAQDAEKNNNKIDDGTTVMAQLDELMKLHKNLPQYSARKGTQKATAVATGLANKFGMRTDQVTGFSGVRNMMVNLVARKLAGEKGVMTDKDFERAEKMVPSEFDSPQQAQAKYNAVQQLYYANPKNNKNYSQPTTTESQSKTNKTKSGVSYEVIN